MKENTKKVLTDSEWKQVLSDEQFRVLRNKETERPFSGKYNKFYEKGVYCCAACGSELFSSDTKFDAGCGWPSFSDVVSNKNIITAIDTSFGMTRTEILCAICGGHLGHLFDDGPLPSSKRYCTNSVSLKFIKK